MKVAGDVQLGAWTCRPDTDVAAEALYNGVTGTGFEPEIGIVSFNINGSIVTAQDDLLGPTLP